MLTVQRLQNWNNKMNNSESFLLLLKNLLKCTYEVLLPSQRHIAQRQCHYATYNVIYIKQCMFSETFGAVWITYLFYDANTNYSQHRLCFPTLIWNA